MGQPFMDSLPTIRNTSAATGSSSAAFLYQENVLTVNSPGSAKEVQWLLAPNYLKKLREGSTSEEGASEAVMIGVESKLGGGMAGFDSDGAAVSFKFKFIQNPFSLAGILHILDCGNLHSPSHSN